MSNVSPCDAQQVLAYEVLSRGRAVFFERDSYMSVRLLLWCHSVENQKGKPSYTEWGRVHAIGYSCQFMFAQQIRIV